MARKNKAGKGNLPSGLIGKEGALKTQLMVLKGRKLEAQENGEDTTEIDAQIAKYEAEQESLERTIEEAMRHVA